MTITTSNSKYAAASQGAEDPIAPISAAMLPSYGAAAEAETVTFDEPGGPSQPPRAVPASAIIEEVSPLISSAEGTPVLGGYYYDDDNKEFAAPACRDIPFAVMFYLHFAVMVWLGVDIAPRGYAGFRDNVDFAAIHDELSKSDDITEDQLVQLEQMFVAAGEYVRVYPQRVLTYLSIPMGFIAFFAALIMILGLMKPCPRVWVYGCLIESFAIMGAVMITGCVMSNNFFMYLVTGVSLAAIAYYVKIAWRMVPFASVNLKVAVRAIGNNCGIFIVAFVFAKLGLLYVGYWCYVVVGTFAYKSFQCQKQHPEANFDPASDNYDDECDPPFIIVVLFLVSLYWTTTITMVR